MKAVSSHSIIDLYVFLDDHLAKRRRTGRPPALSESEILTILIFSSLSENHQRLSEVYEWVGRVCPGWFRLPRYADFAAAVHRAAPVMAALLNGLLASRAPLRFADSTMLPVRKRYRSKSHRAAKGVAAWGRNHQDWHYGFKLHLSIDAAGRLCAYVFTPANEHDNQVMDKLVNQYADVLVGDRHYGGRMQRKKLWGLFRTVVVAPPQIRQNRQLLAGWQLKLLRARSKIEAVYGVLKEKFRLASSCPRSVTGYFAHYVRVLLGYQMSLVS